MMDTEIEKKPAPPIIMQNNPTRNKIAVVWVIIFLSVLVWQFYKIIHNMWDISMPTATTTWSENIIDNSLMDSNTAKMVEDQLKSINERTSLPDVNSINKGGE